MKKLLLGLAFLSAFSLTSARAEDAKQDFNLINKTGYEIKEVYVSPSKSDDWEEDVLGEDTLSDGDKQEIKFNRSEKTCKWDLKVTYSDDDSSVFWRDIDLCKVEDITIRYDKKADKTSATFD